jgi:acetate kinase
MRNVLTINSGSSSLRFAVFRDSGALERALTGKFDRLGLPDARLAYTDPRTGKKTETGLGQADHVACVQRLIGLLEQMDPGLAVDAIGHRIVHGGPRYLEPQQVDGEMLAELRRLSPFDPEHLPAEIAVMEAFAARFPGVPQIACFDTAFHRDMPRVAAMLPIPRRYEAQGVRRYGFHGLSYTYLLAELERLAGRAAAQGRVILAHLGNGASMAAVREGRCMDTTMGFTPAAGLVMSTRTGDIDPGLVAFLARTEGMTAEQFHEMAITRSGLLGVSEISSDVRDLEARAASDIRAAEALALFCYQARKWIGALSSALGGLDTLVFAGGIGENAPGLRAQICEGLGFLGVELDAQRNKANDPIISTEASRVTVRVIRTDEELLIAQSMSRLLGKKPQGNTLPRPKGRGGSRRTT